MAGLYIHIPFCKKACHYCNFHFSTSLKNRKKIISSMIKEIEIKSIGYEDLIETIYFGGGTPSLLIDNKGNISLADVENLDKLTNYIPNFKSILNQSIEKIPVLFPATKTNIGVPVSTKFKLPLIIKSN